MPTTATKENVVALYWDFENVHACVVDSLYGKGKYHDNYYVKQPPVVEVSAIVNYATSVGVVAINRAYNHWQHFAGYSDALNQNGLDLIQLYPIGAKNGADIRLALDVIEDLQRFEHVTHVVIVSSDRDYISLAQKVKQIGRKIIGIGVRANTNPYWVQCCDEFKFYENLVALTTAAPEGSPATAGADGGAEGGDRDDARELLVRSMRDLVALRGSDVVPRSQLKGLMVRHNPAFDHAALGFVTFSHFIEAFPELVENIPNESGGSVRWRENVTPGAGGEAPTTTPASDFLAVNLEAGSAAANYAALLRGSNLRVLPAPWWRHAVEAVEQVFAAAGGAPLANFEELRQRVADVLRAAGQEANLAAINQVRINLFGLFQFDLLPHQGGIRLGPPRTPHESSSLLVRVETKLVRRLVHLATPPLDEAGVATLLYGDDSAENQERARDAIAAAGGVPAGGGALQTEAPNDFASPPPPEPPNLPSEPRDLPPQSLV